MRSFGATPPPLWAGKGRRRITNLQWLRTLSLLREAITTSSFPSVHIRTDG